MGRGDKRSKRGKRTLGSFGVKRQARVQNKVLKNVATEVVAEKAKPAAKKKAASDKYVAERKQLRDEYIQLGGDPKVANKLTSKLELAKIINNRKAQIEEEEKQYEEVMQEEKLKSSRKILS
jgi:ribosomal small subunit protein bTHX